MRWLRFALIALQCCKVRFPSIRWVRLYDGSQSLVTSGHPPFLRSLPLKRLQAYTKAYGLNTTGAIEKEDFVQTIIKAKNPVTGCLPPDAEVSLSGRGIICPT